MGPCFLLQPWGLSRVCRACRAQRHLTEGPGLLPAVLGAGNMCLPRGCRKRAPPDGKQDQEKMNEQHHPVHFPRAKLGQVRRVQQINKRDSRQTQGLGQPGASTVLSAVPLNWKCAKPRSPTRGAPERPSSLLQGLFWLRPWAWALEGSVSVSTPC